MKAGALKPDRLAAAGAKVGHPVHLRMQPLYDHSYYFISTFMRDHIDHHARALGCRPASSKVKKKKSIGCFFVILLLISRPFIPKIQQTKIAVTKF